MFRDVFADMLTRAHRREQIESSSVKRSAPGGGAASTTAGGSEARDAKRQRKDAPAAAAAPKEITLENLRKAIEDDSEMTVKKLVSERACPP